MTTDKFVDKDKVIKGPGAEASDVTGDEKHDEATADKAEEKVKQQAAEIKEQTARPRVRHNRG